MVRKKKEQQCLNCNHITYDNPIPVVVALIPVLYKNTSGVLIGKRGNQQEIAYNTYNLIGGFLEIENWKKGIVRELKEEINLELEENLFEPFYFSSSEPNPNRILLFGLYTKQIMIENYLSSLNLSQEINEIGLICNNQMVDILIHFTKHQTALHNYFNRHIDISASNYRNNKNYIKIM